MYNWHKFWGRKTWNMDPFSGSGVTALEALKLGRRALAVDINPVATEILRLTTSKLFCALNGIAGLLIDTLQKEGEPFIPSARLTHGEQQFVVAIAISFKECTQLR